MCHDTKEKIYCYFHFIATLNVSKIICFSPKPPWWTVTSTWKWKSCKSGGGVHCNVFFQMENCTFFLAGLKHWYNFFHMDTGPNAGQTKDCQNSLLAPNFGQFWIWPCGFLCFEFHLHFRKPPPKCEKFGWINFINSLHLMENPCERTLKCHRCFPMKTASDLLSVSLEAKQSTGCLFILPSLFSPSDQHEHCKVFRVTVWLPMTQRWPCKAACFWKVTETARFVAEISNRCRLSWHFERHGVELLQF